MNKKIRIAVAALTGRVIAGNENSKGTEITEFSRQDVTSDFMKALIDKAEYHGGSFEIAGGGETWDATVTKRGQAPAFDEAVERVKFEAWHMREHGYVGCTSQCENRRDAWLACARQKAEERK